MSPLAWVSVYPMCKMGSLWDRGQRNVTFPAGLCVSWELPFRFPSSSARSHALMGELTSQHSLCLQCMMGNDAWLESPTRRGEQRQEATEPINHCGNLAGSKDPRFGVLMLLLPTLNLQVNRRAFLQKKDLFFFFKKTQCFTSKQRRKTISDPRNCRDSKQSVDARDAARACGLPPAKTSKKQGTVSYPAVGGTAWPSSYALLEG